MKKTIGIVAPIIGGTQAHIDFTVRLKRNQRELTLKTLYELAQNGYQTEKIGRGFRYEEMATAAGYYLSSVLRQQGYQTVLTTTYDDEALQQLAAADPLAVCLSTTMIIDTTSLKTVARQIRHHIPDALIIAGGGYLWKNYYIYREQQGLQGELGDMYHTLFHGNSLDTGIDIFVIAPHGRASLFQVLQEVERGSRADFTQIPNLAIPQNAGTFVFTPLQEEVVDYNTDYTRWDLVDELPNEVPIRTSIGCPFRCRFCDFCHLYPRLFFRSKDSLLQELQLLKQRMGKQAATLFLTDDNVFINAQRVHDVCDAIMTAAIPGWQGFLRVSSITPSNIFFIRQSGLFRTLIGVESGDPGQLQRMNKAQRPEDVKRGLELLDRQGIASSMTFLVGFPGETAESVENTGHFLNQLSLGKTGSTYQLYPLFISPLSDVARATFRNKWKISGSGTTWSHATMNSDEAVQACYDIFKQVSHVPYHYQDDNNLFDRQVFTEAQRLDLYALRQRLTVQLLEHTAWQPIAATLRGISHTMGFPEQTIPESFRREIAVPAIQGINR